eukprot:6379536-Amphidinium_carterae.1
MASCKCLGPQIRSNWLIQSPGSYSSWATGVERKTTCGTTGGPSAIAMRSTSSPGNKRPRSSSCGSQMPKPA